MRRLAVAQVSGLDSAEIKARQRRYGQNRLPESAGPTPLAIFLRQFKSLVIVVLAGAAALAASIGNYKDASVILAVLLLNAAVGFYQEFRAERSLSALRNMLPAVAKVRRDETDGTVPANELGRVVN